MPEFFSGLHFAVAIMTETCRNSKRIDFGRENEALIFY